MEDNKILYDYKRRSSIVDENSLATLDYLYSLSMPKPLTSYSEMENDDTHPNGEYVWPMDFYYIPENVMNDIWDNRLDAYNIRMYWEDCLGSLIKMLFEEPGAKTVYSPTEWSNGKNVKHYETIPMLKDVIGEDSSDKVKDILETYKKSYKWGIADYNRFNFAKLNAPSNNREIVISAWKDVFGVDVEIPDDSTWMDVYTAIDEEEKNEDNE